MNDFDTQPHGLTDCIIYTRVSSLSQMERGQGAESQEVFCRRFAESQGYTVWGVFFDKGVSGARLDREGIQDALAFLRKHKKQRRFVLIVDDISRLARHIRVHLDLRDAIDACGAVLESPSRSFGSDPDGRYFENMQALGAQHYRDKIRETTKKRRTARLMGGYWPFSTPIGYRSERVEGHGNMLVRDEPLASIIQEALESYASGRLQSQAEVARFLQSRPEFPKNRFGVVTNEAANRVLRRLLYSGHLEMPKYGIDLREGKHEGLVTLETFNRIQARLAGKAYVPARADLSEDFPLRSFVLCTCGKPLTANWSRSKTGARHPYYMCFNKTCEHNRKSIRRADIEGRFEALLEYVQPSQRSFEFVRKILKKAWDYHHERAKAAKTAIRQKIAELERQSATMLDSIVTLSNTAVIARFEDKIGAIEAERLALVEKLETKGASHRPFEEMFELAMQFLGSPINLWNNSQVAAFAEKRTVLKLTFAEPLVYDRFEGFRTPKTSIVFSALKGGDMPNFKMADRVGFEPTKGFRPWRFSRPLPSTTRPPVLSGDLAPTSRPVQQVSVPPPDRSRNDPVPGIGLTGFSGFATRLDRCTARSWTFRATDFPSDL